MEPTSYQPNDEIKLKLRPGSWPEVVGFTFQRRIKMPFLITIVIFGLSSWCAFYVSILVSPLLPLIWPFYCSLALPPEGRLNKPEKVEIYHFGYYLATLYLLRKGCG